MRYFTLAVLAASLALLPGCVAKPVATPTIASNHQPSWMDATNAEFHGAVVKAALYDYTKAKWSGVTCNTCHAGTSADQVSPLKTAPNCFLCHAGGPDGTPGHPAGWGNPSLAGYHGAVVIAALYDYTKARSGALTCNTCHGGDSPSAPSANSRAPSCFACHAGGPDGSAGHPPIWAIPGDPGLGSSLVGATYPTHPTPFPDATISLDPQAYSGLSLPVGVTVVDPGAIHSPGIVEAVSVTASSSAEPAGETFWLYETLPGSGTFVGTIPLERVFDEAGGQAAIAHDGKLAVYAEGDVATDMIALGYAGVSALATYEEPSSTVTGIVRVGGTPVGGAGVQLGGAAGFARATVSRSDGSYAFHEIAAGFYTLVAAKNGAQPLTTTVVVP